MMAEPLDHVVRAVLELVHGLRAADLMHGDDKIAVRLPTKVGERLELMIAMSGRVPFSDRYGMTERVADGAIASLIIADVEFQWSRPRYVKGNGESTHYPHLRIMGSDGTFEDPGSND